MGGAAFPVVTQREAEQLIPVSTAGESLGLEKKRYRIIKKKTCQCRLRFVLQVKKNTFKVWGLDITVPYVNIKIFYFAKTFSLLS